MSHSALQDIESRIQQLSLPEKQLLLDQLTRDLRKSNVDRVVLAANLALMAADPDIQREIREINEEFAGTEEDGLEGL